MYINLKLDNKLMKEIVFFVDDNNIDTNNNKYNYNTFIENVNLIELKPKEKDLIYEKLEVYGINRYKKYIPKLIKTPESYFLKITEAFQDDWVVCACKKYNLKNIGLLANVFPDIFGQDEDLVAQDIFFEKINYVENKLNELGISKTPVDLSYFEKKELISDIETIEHIIPESEGEEALNIGNLIFGNLLLLISVFSFGSFWRFVGERE